MDPRIPPSNNGRLGGANASILAASAAGESFQLEEINVHPKSLLKSNLDSNGNGSVPKLTHSTIIPMQSDGDDEFSDSSDSEVEYSKKVTRKITVRTPNSGNFTKEKRRKQEIVRNASGVSDDNFGFGLDPNSIKVARTDVIFSLIVLFASIGDFSTDFGLIWWHYADGFNWVSTFTCFLMILGAGGMLNHFSHVDSDTLNRLFLNGKRVKILTSCFPFLGAVISSYHCMLTAIRARTEQIFCQQFFAVEDFSLNLLRIQSFFQAAPQATLQLVVLMETFDQISSTKALFSIMCVVLSLTVMTLANLPYKNQNAETMVMPSAYGAHKRLFIACRMFSSFGSRAMAIAYLLKGLQCLLPNSTFASVLLGMILILVPRLIFTFADYVKQLMKARRSRNPQEFQKLSCCATFVGYFATIFIPMSDPLWVFWYVWSESALFVLFGNIVGWATGYIPNFLNAIYTGIFIVVFIVIPILIPFARVSAQRKHLKRMEKFFDHNNGEISSSPGLSPTSSSSVQELP